MPGRADARAEWHPGWALVASIASISLLGYLCAKPIVDSDLWFHLAYARQMIGNRTLILDHTAFSWTPADNSVIYNAWLSQLVLYALHQMGGLTALFALRYAVFIAVLAAAAAYAHHSGVLRHPFTWLLMAVALLMSSAAFFVKPQLASYAFMNVTVLAWFWIRRLGDRGWKVVYALPLLMLVWVNAHGGFVVGLAFLAVAVAGEFLNVKWSPTMALSPRLRHHVLVAVALSFMAVFVTPYGWHYPLQFLTVDLSAVDLAAVREFDSIFAPTQRPFRYVEYGMLATVFVTALMVHRVRLGAVEWSLLLSNLAFAGLYAYYVRLTFFWAPVMLFSGITLVAEAPSWLTPSSRRRSRMLGAAMLATLLLVAAYVIRAEAATVVVGGWQGFGNGYWNPEEEAEYIARELPDARIGNDYNAGGYLIWRLGPERKVFIDARYFPYRSWFQEYQALESTSGIGPLLDKYKADLWCVDLLLPSTVAWLRSSPDWTPAFYGASAAVFVRRGTPIPGARLQAGVGLSDIRNLYQALLVLAFAFDVRDLEGAERVVAGMERRFTRTNDRAVVAGARTAVDGLAANQRGDHGRAVRLLSGIADGYQGRPAAALVESAMAESGRLWQAGDGTGALSMSILAARFGHQTAQAQYNAGAIGWWLQRESPGTRDQSWRVYLETFEGMSKGDPMLAAAVQSARSMLSGQQWTKPTVLIPSQGSNTTATRPQ